MLGLLDPVEQSGQESAYVEGGHAVPAGDLVRVGAVEVRGQQPQFRRLENLAQRPVEQRLP
ncbi:hypothetical protein ACIQU4_27290 [Streptomyces sp. NPDC090741]|uniref:hypothetical protein n=1 Tax=Streptomyces sp. NPDC090741 TaxID=3365967 RepID=UPI0038303874